MKCGLLPDLHKLGGLTAVIKDLNNSNPEIRTISAWILGKASQNNPFVQNQVCHLPFPLNVKVVHVFLDLITFLSNLGHTSFSEGIT